MTDETTESTAAKPTLRQPDRDRCGRYFACGPAPADLHGWLVIGLGDDVCGFRLFPPPGFAA